MNIILNGEPAELHGTTIADLIAQTAPQKPFAAVAHKLSEHAVSLQLSDDGLPAVSGKSSIAGSLPVLLLAAVLAVVAFKGCSTKVVEQGQDRPFEADVVQPHFAANQSLPALPLPDEAVTTPNGPVAESASGTGG